jgi:PAS domain S-box-containing protein
VVIALALHDAHSRAIGKASAEGRNLALGLAEHMASSVRAIDFTLRYLREEWLRDPGSFAAAVVRQQEILKDEAVDQVLVFSENGRTVYGSLPTWRPRDVNARPYFSVHKQRATDELDISEPAVGLVSGKRTIRFTRPIYDRHQQFAGVLVFSVLPPALERIYKDMQLGDSGVITLARSDGQIVTRSDNFEKAANTSIAGAPGLSPADAPAGEFRRVSAVDGVERFYRYQKVPRYPLILYVGQAVDTVLAPYYAQRTISLASGALATALLAAFMLLLIFRRRDREAAERNRARAEADLRLSEDRYRDLVENSRDLICTHGLDGRILSVNPVPAKALGYQPDEMLNLHLRDVLAPEVRHEFDEYIAAIRKDGSARGLMLVQTRKGEKRIWRYNNSLRTEGLPVPVVRGMAQDVTESIAAHKALEESQARLASIVDAAMDAIITADETGRILVFNRAAETIFRCSAADAIGQSLERFIPQRFHAVHRDHMRQFGVAGADARAMGLPGAVVGLRANGEEFPFEAAISRVTVGGRRVFTVMLRDIVGRIAAAEKQRDVLVREVHHRIKNNLQGVIGLMQQHAAAHPELNDLVERMVGQIRAVALVHGMGGASAQDEVGLRKLITDISEAAAAFAQIEVVAEGAVDASGPVRIARDEAVPIALLLNELLFNAIRHGANQTGEGNIRIEVSKHDRLVRVRISNPGVLAAPDFDFARGAGLGNGLRLIKALLPRRGAKLEIVQEGGQVVADLTLTDPVIVFS